MSYGSEIATEMMIGEAIAYEQEVARIKEGTWTTKDGIQISITNMSTSHIQNCIRYLSKNDDCISQMWLTVFEQELNYRMMTDVWF